MALNRVAFAFALGVETSIRGRTPQPIAGLTMRQVLDLIVGLDPRYTWREVDGVAVVRPSAAWSDPNDALNRHVQNIHWTARTRGRPSTG
jgi:hypothetical protein